MAIISGTTVNWGVSPRIIIIPLPITEATIEDLQDTLQDLEDDEIGVVFQKLRTTAGGEDLGGGTSVGWTMTLNNAQIQFQGRTTATESGAVSSNDTTGTLLNASGGQFVTNNVSRGNTVFNSTTGSMATILSVTDEQNLISQQITGGTRTTWLNTDNYTIYANVQCNIFGGNLVAVDDVGATISPVLESPNTNVVRTSSSSSTALAFDEQVQDLSDRIETLRDSHAGYGIIYYWDPENGSDASDGLLRATGRKTWTAVHALLSPGDSVICIAPSTGYVTDQIVLTTDNIQIRGPGNTFWLRPGSDVEPVIFNGTVQSSLSSIRIDKFPSSVKDGIKVTNSDYARFFEVDIWNQAGNGFYITTTHKPVIDTCFVHGSRSLSLGGHGIEGALGCNHMKVINCFLSNIDEDGIHLDGTSINSIQVGEGTKIQYCAGWGIWLGDDPAKLSVDSSTVLASNVLGDIRGDVANEINFMRDIENQPIIDAKYLIEMQRAHHTGYGDMYFWDPTNGDDDRDGKTPDKAVATFAQAHTLCQDGHHDVIVAVASAIGQTITTETIVISKNYVFLRGPGRDFLMKPVTNTAPTIEITGVGVQVESMMVDTSLSGAQNAIKVSAPADFFNLSHIWTKDTTGTAIYIDGTATFIEFGLIEECVIESPGVHGILIEGDVQQTAIVNCKIASAEDGIHLTGSQPRDISIIGSKTQIYGHAFYGINIQPNSIRTLIDNNVKVHDNGSGQINDLGLITLYADNIYQDVIVDKVFDEAYADHTTAGTTGKLLNELRVANYNRRKHDKVAKTITLYDDDKVTPNTVFDTNDDVSDITPQ